MKYRSQCTCHCHEPEMTVKHIVACCTADPVEYVPPPTMALPYEPVDIEELVKSHTRYSVKCECGEYLLKRKNGFMSERDQWELHFIEVLREALQ